MKEKIKNFIQKNTPPGTDVWLLPRYLVVGVTVAVVYSFSFWHRFFERYFQLFVREGNVTVLSGLKMTDFHELYHGSMLAFFTFMLLCAAFVIYFYAYYRQGSKSIYLMRRLPKKFEMHRRAFLIPLIMCAIFFALAVIITFIYFGLYMLITPNECLYPDQWQKFWRYLL